MDSLIGLFVLLVALGVILALWLIVKLAQALAARASLGGTGGWIVFLLLLIAAVVGPCPDRPAPGPHPDRWGRPDPVCAGCESQSDPACQPPCEAPGDCWNSPCAACGSGGGD